MVVYFLIVAADLSPKFAFKCIILYMYTWLFFMMSLKLVLKTFNMLLLLQVSTWPCIPSSNNLSTFYTKKYIPSTHLWWSIEQ